MNGHGALIDAGNGRDFRTEIGPRRTATHETCTASWSAVREGQSEFNGGALDGLRAARRVENGLG